MEFYAQQSELLDKLDLMQGALERKSTIPILSHFLVETVGSRLQISASDLEVGARSSCKVELKSEGKAAADAGGVSKRGEGTWNRLNKMN